MALGTNCTSIQIMTLLVSDRPSFCLKTEHLQNVCCSPIAAHDILRMESLITVMSQYCTLNQTLIINSNIFVKQIFSRQVN